MPRAITHYLFAMDALNRLDDNTQNIINNNLDMFKLGCQGANIFNYYNDFSFLNNKSISDLSPLIHHSNINLFFKNMIMYCSNKTLLNNLFNNTCAYESCISYMYGFLSHYSLDKICNPYVRSLQLNLKNQYKYKSYKALHKSIETHIDQIILHNLKHVYPYEFNDYLNININSNDLMLICDMYTFLLSSVYNKNISCSDIKKSYITFKKVESKINSSSSLFSKVYLNIKNKTSKNALIDSEIYSNFKMCQNDLINKSKSIWINPHNLKEYNYSFLDLYKISLKFYIDLIDCLNVYLNNQSDLNSILSKISSEYI